MKRERLRDECAKIKARPDVADDGAEVPLPPQLLEALQMRLSE